MSCASGNPDTAVPNAGSVIAALLVITNPTAPEPPAEEPPENPT